MNYTKLKEILKDCFLFKNVPPSKADALIDGISLEIREFNSGMSVYTCENEEKTVGFILKGSVKVYRDGDGFKVLLKEKGIGDIFGASLMYSDSSCATSKVISGGSTVIGFLNEEQFDRLVFSDKQITENYLRFLTSKIRFLTKKITDLTAEGNDEKIKNYLLELSDNGKDGNNTDITINYQKSAKLLNMSRASLYRALDRLEEDGFLKKDGNKITINRKD